ncbi:MAG: hypothetical protein AAB595_02175 [Patescibacteria group bacterium]
MTTESYLSISPKTFGKDWDCIKNGKEVDGETNLTSKLPLGYWTEKNGLGTKLTLSFGPETQNIILSQKELPYGTRFLFTCECGKTCNNLYLHKNKWRCGKCAGLKYESSRINRHSTIGSILYRAMWANKATDINEVIGRHKIYRNKPTRKFKSFIKAATKACLDSHVRAANMLVSLVGSL